jgi:hypothetical protein
MILNASEAHARAHRNEPTKHVDNWTAKEYAADLAIEVERAIFSSANAGYGRFVHWYAIHPGTEEIQIEAARLVAEELKQAGYKDVTVVPETNTWSERHYQRLEIRGEF